MHVCMRLIHRCLVKWDVMFLIDTRWQANLNMEEHIRVMSTVCLCVYIFILTHICVYVEIKVIKSVMIKL